MIYQSEIKKWNDDVTLSSQTPHICGWFVKVMFGLPHRVQHIVRKWTKMFFHIRIKCLNNFMSYLNVSAILCPMLVDY